MLPENRGVELGVDPAALAGAGQPRALAKRRGGEVAVGSVVRAVPEEGQPEARFAEAATSAFAVVERGDLRVLRVL